MAKAADCKSAIVGSTPTGASLSVRDLRAFGRPFFHAVTKMVTYRIPRRVGAIVAHRHTRSRSATSIPCDWLSKAFVDVVNQNLRLVAFTWRHRRTLFDLVHRTSVFASLYLEKLKICSSKVLPIGWLGRERRPRRCPRLEAIAEFVLWRGRQ